MAKLASQAIVIQIFNAVPDGASDIISVLDAETISQLQEAVVALVNDAGAVVEVVSE